MESAPEQRLIPTHYRSPISKELSYPVGAEIVSGALTSAPQFDILTLTFFNAGTPADLRRRIARGAEVVVFRATYLRSRWRTTEEWDLTVYAVPKERKAETRRLLIEQGLSRVRSWLSAEHPPVWYYGRKECKVLVRFEDAALLVRED